MTNELATMQTGFEQIEKVLMTGNLAELNPQQRVEYYNAVCKSIGLNPLTRPFDYIQLNGKLTLYAKKDAADQLRKINGVSIDDVDISEVGDTYLVKVKGHDQTGRSDVEIGVVKKSDMQGNTANAQMKAVTKAKRRLTLSLCGLGWLDETEVETIKDASPVKVAATGEIIDTDTEEQARAKGLKLYHELAVRAKAVGVEADDLPEDIALAELRSIYADLKKFVEDAEEQARA